jgi:hypothetical protein
MTPYGIDLVLVIGDFLERRPKCFDGTRICFIPDDPLHWNSQFLFVFPVLERSKPIGMVGKENLNSALFHEAYADNAAPACVHADEITFPHSSYV